MAGYVDPGEFASEILPNGDYADLFVYMYRRFGISEYGSDDYKEIACWYVTTPDPAVVLVVSPRPSGLRYSFGYEIDSRVYGLFYQNESTPEKERVEAAIKQAMIDLTVPVNVRDVYINALGKVDDDNLTSGVCEPSKWAGYGVTSDYFKKLRKRAANKS